jgi:hypothetical protein
VKKEFLITNGIECVTVAEGIKLASFVKQSGGHHTVNAGVNALIEQFAGKGQPKLTDMKGARFRLACMEGGKGAAGTDTYFEGVKDTFVVMRIYPVIVNGIAFVQFIKKGGKSLLRIAFVKRQTHSGVRWRYIINTTTNSINVKH